MIAPGFTITLLPSKREFASNGEVTILEAAALAGLRLPSSCRNGTCRACICMMKEGNVRYGVEWPGLSAGEKAEGWILPCVAIPLSNVDIEADFAETDASPSAKTRRGRGF